MTPRLRLAAAHQALEPDQQGHLDGLCGLYAIINAYRLVCHPDRVLARPQRLTLFEEGIAYLSAKRQLKPMLVSGMAPRAWVPLARHVLAEAGDIVGIPVRLVIIKPPVDPLRAIRRALKAGLPVIVSLEGRIHHWTVVARFTETRLLLFDSDGRASIMLSSFDRPGDSGYRITPGGLALIERKHRVDKHHAPP